MKFLKYFLFVSLAVSFSTSFFSVALASNPTCPGVAATLTWSSTGATPPCSSTAGPGCGLGSITSAGGSAQVTLNSGSCTVTYNCQNSAGVWGTQAGDTLNTFSGATLGPDGTTNGGKSLANGCCGAGIYAVGSSDTTNAGKTVWNGTTCVAPVCTGTAPTLVTGMTKSSAVPSVDTAWSYLAPGTAACTWKCDTNYSQSGNTCVANTHTVTFNGNGSTSGSTATQTINDNTSAALTSNGFLRTGYTFAGWATTATGAVAYANGASYTMGTSNVTLYAKWTAVNNTITFNGNGSTGGTMSNQTIATDASANLSSNTFVRTGYTFAGWATTAAGAVAYANGASYTMGTSNVTLYAVWTAIGAISVSISASPSSLTLPANSTTLTWVTTGNPDSCTASNYWSGAKSTVSGSSELRSGMIAQTYIFDITCSKAGVADASDTVTVVVSPVPTCTSPWGTTVADGASVTAYQTSSVFAPSSCTSQTRTCSGGTLSGSYTNQTCAVISGNLSASATTCTIPNNASTCSVNFTWNTVNPIATSAVTKNNPPNTTVFTANNGTNQSTAISGAYPSTTFYLYHSGNLIGGPVTVTPSCSGTDVWDGSRCAAICNLPWGGTTNSGTSVTAYQFSTVPSPTTCASVAQTRTCTNGSLSGTYTNQTCIQTVASGSLTVPASCTIAAGASTCTVTASWTTSNATSPALIDGNTSATLSSSANSAGLTVWVAHPSTVFNLKDGSTVLDTRTVTGSCAGGSTWDGTKCSANCTSPWGTNVNGGTSITAYQTSTVTSPSSCTSQSRTCNNGSLSGAYTNQTCSVMSGSVTSSSPTCTIASGASSCTVNLTWSTTNPAATSAITRNNPAGTVFTANNGTNQSVSVSGAYANVSYYLYNSGDLLDFVTVTPSCTSGTSWNGSICVPPPTATLTVPNCTIAINASSCTSLVSWTSTNPVLPFSVRQNGVEFSTAVSSVGVSRILQNGSGASNTFTALSNGSTLSTRTGTASCAAGSTWNGTICLTNVAIGTFTLTTATVYQGGSTNLNWTGVTGGGTVTCSINNGVGAVTPIPSGSASTGSRIADTTFTLTCVNGVGPSATRSVTLNVISGTLNMSASSCVIPINSSLCSVNATWSTTHTTSPKLVDGNLPASTTLSTLANNAVPFAVNVAYPQTVFFLDNLSTTLATKTVTATCAPLSGYDPVSNKCVGAPVVTLTPLTQTISYNKPATIAWSSTNSTSCSPNSANWNPGPAVSGSVATNAFTTPQTVSITCVGPAAISTIADATVNVCTAIKPVWDGATCQPAPVSGISISSGQYTPAGTLTINCSNSTSYSVVRDGVTVVDSGVITSGSFAFFTKNINISTAGSYTTICSVTSADGFTFPITSTPVIYDTKPPEPIVSLRQTPASIAKGSATIISWTVLYPNSVQVPPRSACTLTAKAVCANGVCTTEQSDAVAVVNAILATEKTDVSDVAGSRRINPDAVNNLINPDLATTDWKATGKKTFHLERSTDFLLNCGAGKNASSTVRVQVTHSLEG